MASKEQGIGSVKYIIDKLRYITLAVQIIPFAYSALYIATMTAYLFCSDSVLFILDSMFYTSPIVMSAFLVLSDILRLCKWHKLACMLPCLPQLFIIVDYYIVELTSVERVIAVATPIALSALLLLAAYNVFFR